MNKNDLIQGNILKNLIIFSLPLFLGNVLQVTYSTVDSIWVGNKIGDVALGAVSVSFPIIFILTGFIMGLTMATTVLVSQYAGANNQKMVNKTVNNSFLLIGIAGVIVTIIGLVMSRQILVWMNTPAETLPYAVDYLHIIFFSIIFMFGYNLISSILRGLGDSKTPLYFLAVTTIINIILDPILIIGIGPFPKMGISGAALATLIAQAISFFLSLVYLKRYNKMIRIRAKEFKFDKDLSKRTITIGLPAGIQQTVVSFGIMALTSIISSFGHTTLSAYGAASRIDQYAIMPAMSIGIAASAFTGQAIGSKQVEKVKEIYKYASLITLIITGIISILILSFPQALLSLFNQDETLLRIGSQYLRIVGYSYLFFGFMFITNGILRGAGDTIATMIFSIVSLIGIRVPLAYILSKYTNLDTQGIWLAIAISFVFTFVLSQIYYYTGIWKRKNVIFNEQDDLEYA